jgi:hypothetical protein
MTSRKIKPRTHGPYTDFLTPAELLKRWKKPVTKSTLGTLANQRCRGDGPYFTKLPKDVLYPLEEVVAYELERTVTTSVRYA